MDRSAHQRYLVYLKKYEYFGRGKERLDAASFSEFDSELAAIEAKTDAAQNERRRELRALLLRD